MATSVNESKTFPLRHQKLIFNTNSSICQAFCLFVCLGFFFFFFYFSGFILTKPYAIISLVLITFIYTDKTMKAHKTHAGQTGTGQVRAKSRTALSPAVQLL